MERYEQEREELMRMLRFSCNDLFFHGSLRTCEDTIDVIENMFETYSLEDLRELMGGEFPFGNSSREEYTNVPIYLYMELLADIVDMKFGTGINAESVQPIVSKLRQFREDTANFPHNDMFDPNKHITNGVVKDIIAAKGDIYLGVTQVGDKKFPSIRCTETREDITWRRDGEPIPGDVSRNGHDYPCLYFEDEVEYKKHVSEENAELKERFRRITGAYFKEGYLPTDPDDFKELLNDGEIHPNIKYILETIRERREEFAYGESGELAWMKECQNFLRGIQRLERNEQKAMEEEKTEILEEEKPTNETEEVDERKQAIKDARKRYSTQNPFMRWVKEITGKQQRFDGIEFDDLSTSEINKLFPESKKGKK